MPIIQHWQAATLPAVLAEVQAVGGMSVRARLAGAAFPELFQTSMYWLTRPRRAAVRTYGPEGATDFVLVMRERVEAWEPAPAAVLDVVDRFPRGIPYQELRGALRLDECALRVSLSAWVALKSIGYRSRDASGTFEAAEFSAVPVEPEPPAMPVYVV